MLNNKVYKCVITKNRFTIVVRAETVENKIISGILFFLSFLSIIISKPISDNSKTIEIGT